MNARITVQLADVMAPGPAHPLGPASPEALTELCLGKGATLRTTGTALDGTTVGHPTCGGRSTAREQVKLGLAEVRGRLLPEDTLMLEVQREARRTHRGLWSR